MKNAEVIVNGSQYIAFMRPLMLANGGKTYCYFMTKILKETGGVEFIIFQTINLNHSNEG